MYNTNLIKMVEQPPKRDETDSRTRVAQHAGARARTCGLGACDKGVGVTSALYYEIKR